MDIKLQRSAIFTETDEFWKQPDALKENWSREKIFLGKKIVRVL